MTLPTGIYSQTMQPEATIEQGMDVIDDSPVLKTAKAKKRKASTTDTTKVEDMKLYLSEDVRFRLRMLAFKRGAKISTVANEVLDKALPRWTLERTE